jgi:hypothetical protein
VISQGVTEGCPNTLTYVKTVLRFGNSAREMSVDIQPPDYLQTGVGVHRLRFQVDFDGRHTVPEGTPIQATVHVSMGPGMNDWVGQAQPDRPIITSDQPFNNYLAVALSDEQLAVIEQRRAGGDITFNFTVHLVLGYELPAVTPTPAVYGFGPWPTGEIPISVNVQGGVWERVLSASTKGLSLAIVVPVPLGTDSIAARAGEHLRDAIRKVNAGQYGDAVVTARKALDALGEPSASEKSIVSETPAMERTITQRRLMLRHALASLAAPAAHGDPVADAITWDRGSALSVIAAVAAYVAVPETAE